MEILNPLQRLRLNEVENLTGWKKSKLYELIKEGKFPTPLKPEGGRSSRWLAGSVLAYLEATTQVINDDQFAQAIGYIAMDRSF